MNEYPYRYHIALDGNGINGFEGMAGVCLFLLDPDTGDHAYKIRYFDGIAGGHAVSVNPSGTVGFLGSASQQLLFYDAKTLEEIERVSTLPYETTATPLHGSTHVVWIDDATVITCIGEHLYRFTLGALDHAERLGPHRVKLPHAMKSSASKRYIVYGSMDHPIRGAAREVGVFDLETAEAHRVDLPTTCWHLGCHPQYDWFYPLSFSVHPRGGTDYLDWGMAFLKEYAYEVDASTRRVRRHWATSRETPAHINSDVAISDTELIFCTGGSQSIVLVERESMSRFRVFDERPTVRELLKRPRQVATQVYDSMARGGIFTDTRHFFAALRVSRFSLLDSVYGCALSRDQRWLFSANRGLNRVTVYEYPAGRVAFSAQMPSIQEFWPGLSRLADPRLGFHHSYLISPSSTPASSMSAESSATHGAALVPPVSA